MSDDLRREAEAVANRIDDGLYRLREAGANHLSQAKFAIDLIEAFAKVQWVKEVEAMQQRIEEHHAKDHWYFKSIKLWLTQRKQELEA